MLLLGVGDVLDQREVVALEQAAARRVVVEGRLEVLERQRVVDDPEVALAELRGHVLTGRGRGAGGRGLVVAAAGGEERRRRAGAAADGEEPAPRDRIGGDPPERAGLPARRGNAHRSTPVVWVAESGCPPSSPCPTRGRRGRISRTPAASARCSASHRSRIQCSPPPLPLRSTVTPLGAAADADALPVGGRAQRGDHRLHRRRGARRRPQALALGLDLERAVTRRSRVVVTPSPSIRIETARPWRSPGVGDRRPRARAAAAAGPTGRRRIFTFGRSASASPSALIGRRRRRRRPGRACRRA